MISEYINDRDGKRGNYMKMKFLSQNGVLLLLQKIKSALSQKVDKADGKGLSTNDLTDELLEKLLNAGDSDSIPTDNTQLTNGAGYQNAAQVNEIINSKGYQTAGQVQDAINNSAHLTREIVTSLPSDDKAVEDKIYVLKIVDGESVYYEEYQLIDGKIERIGYNRVDLTGYWNDSDLTEMQSDDINSVCNTVFGIQ